MDENILENWDFLFFHLSKMNTYQSLNSSVPSIELEKRIFFWIATNRIN